MEVKGPIATQKATDLDNDIETHKGSSYLGRIDFRIEVEGKTRRPGTPLKPLKLL